jgi:flagellar protein FlbD
MIRLTRLNRLPLVLNSDLIEHIEMTPDTVISLTTGQKFMVQETSEQVIERIINFRRLVLDGLPVCSWSRRPAASLPPVDTSLREINDGK